jgi:predicted nucleic acid-binding protein
VYLIDSDWLIEVLKGRQTFVRELNRLAPFGVSVSAIVLAELWEGVPDSRDPPRARAMVQGIEQRMQILVVDAPVAQRFGELRNDLRKAGKLIADMDLLIAATALVHNLTLCTQNVKHFSRIPGLSIFSVTS